MNISARIQQSVHIITEYYENRLQPFFDAIDDDLLWIGPAERQWMQGKENILNAFTQEEGRHHLTFRMSNISATPISCGTHACEIILTYLVYTYYPNGAMTVHDQRLHFTWRDKKVTGPDGKKHLVPKAAVIHISNAFPYDDRDKIYPVHYDEMKVRRHSRLQLAPRITISGSNHVCHFLAANSILYIETGSRSPYTVFHTLNGGSSDSTESISKLEKKYSDIFLRVHASQVNPLFVQSIRRFEIPPDRRNRTSGPGQKVCEGDESAAGVGDININQLNLCSFCDLNIYVLYLLPFIPIYETRGPYFYYLSALQNR
ncbi:MAG: LytTR family DNA-binding domain-containing protein [Clostridiaceae bacterium]